MTRHHRCKLCGERDAHLRAGRLGRYSVTCDECEARRGSHLVRTANGYRSRASHRPETTHAAA